MAGGKRRSEEAAHAERHTTMGPLGHFRAAWG